LFADQPGQLQQRGLSRKHALMLIADRTTVGLQGEWLEAFWCHECQDTTWYYVLKTRDNGKVKSSYRVRPAPQELWQQVHGVIQAGGNPSVGEFTRRQSRMVGFNGVKDFKFIG
jgi:hypothetical protein